MFSENADENESKSDERKAGYFINLWSKLGARSTMEQLDQAGISCLRHIIGADENTIKAFLGDTKSLQFPTNPQKALEEAGKIREEITFDEMEKFTFIYTKNMLGLTAAQLKSYARGEFEQKARGNARNFVGNIQGGVERMKEDYVSFYREINKIFPEAHTEDELLWLIGLGNDGAYAMLRQLRNYGSRVLNELETNAHVYK